MDDNNLDLIACRALIEYAMGQAENGATAAEILPAIRLAHEAAHNVRLTTWSSPHEEARDAD
jgi:hypothetical protein